MAITVVNKKTHTGDGYYIGRGSVFGNPFTHLPLGNTKATEQVSTRKDAIELYRWWAIAQYRDNEFFRISFDDLVEKYKRGDDLVLICYCKPLDCHGDILCELIEFVAFFGYLPDREVIDG